MEGENNNTLTYLLQNHNSEKEFDNFTLNFDKHSPSYDHKSFLTVLQDNDKSFTVLFFLNEVTLCCPPLSAICNG